MNYMAMITLTLGVYGYTVLRVTHKEYQQKTKYQLICDP